MPDPSKSQQGGGDDHAAHRQIPAAAAKYVHRNQVERQGDDHARAFPEIGREALAARAAEHGEYFENVKNKHCAERGQHETDEQSGQDFVSVEHDKKG